MGWVYFLNRILQECFREKIDNNLLINMTCIYMTIILYDVNCVIYYILSN